jgi:succinate dehydrogenase / fumarate reductase membrane anchor subunit
MSVSARSKSRNASGEGVGHFIAVRVTSVALAVLAPWFVVSAALSLRRGDYAAALDFLSDPFNAVGVALLLAASLYHMMLGMQDVILDYIHKPSTKMALLLLNALAPLALGAGALYALLAVNFGA